MNITQTRSLIFDEMARQESDLKSVSSLYCACVMLPLDIRTGTFNSFERAHLSAELHSLSESDRDDIIQWAFDEMIFLDILDYYEATDFAILGVFPNALDCFGNPV